MSEPVIEVDYLIVGAGAAGMAFADSLVTESKATIAIVDRQQAPGGHWNHAYPFVRLHQPSAFYGVNSRPLGSGSKDEAGWNQGFYELASGAEVKNYFDLVMQEQFLPSGRVQYFPMNEAGDDGAVTSLVSGERRRINWDGLRGRPDHLAAGPALPTYLQIEHPEVFAFSRPVRADTRCAELIPVLPAPHARRCPAFLRFP